MILVFAGKEVGLSLTKFLLENKYPVSRVVAAQETKDFDFARNHGSITEAYSKGGMASLANSGQRFTWILNLWSPHILSSDILALADHRLNLHPSLVPHCRGNDNAAWAIRSDSPMGVSIIEMNGEIDNGEIYRQKMVDVEFPICGSELQQRLKDELTGLFVQEWPNIYKNPETTPQEKGGSYFRRKQTNEDRVQNGSAIMKLDDFVKWSLAHDFYPGTTAEAIIDGRTYRIRISVDEKKV